MLAWFTSRVFSEDCEIVEMERAAYDEQGADWNQECFRHPPIAEAVKRMRGVAFVPAGQFTCGLVARMERGAIRDGLSPIGGFPDFASLHPAYIVTTLIPRLQFPETLPRLAIKAHELHLLDRHVIGRRGVDLDARQQHRQFQIPIL